MASNSPDADFFEIYADSHNRIVPIETVDIKGDLREGPIIGSGPWVHETWARDDRSTMRRNPDYFLKGLPYLDRYEITSNIDNQTQIAGSGVVLANRGGFDAVRIGDCLFDRSFAEPELDRLIQRGRAALSRPARPASPKEPVPRSSRTPRPDRCHKPSGSTAPGAWAPGSRSATTGRRTPSPRSSTAPAPWRSRSCPGCCRR